MPPDVQSNLDSCSGAVVEQYPTWMQMIFQEPNATLVLSLATL